MKKQKRRKTEIQQIRIDIKIMRAELESLKAEVRRSAAPPYVIYPFAPYYPKPNEVYCGTLKS